VQHDITMPTKIDTTSINSSHLSSHCVLSSSTENISRHRPLSEPSAVTELCLNSDVQILNNAFGSVELMEETNDGDCAVVSSSTGSSVCVTNTASSAKSAPSEYTCEVHHPSALMLTESCVNSVSGATSTAAVDDKSNCILAVESGSVWRKVKPSGSFWGAVTGSVSQQGSMKCVSSSEPALNDAGISRVISLSTSAVTNMAVDDVFMAEIRPGIERKKHIVRSDLNAHRGSVTGNVHEVVHYHIINVDKASSDDRDVGCLLLPLASEKCETDVDANDSDGSHNETGYDLTDNNVVTAHQLRDDIPDSELIDYSDDGGESLIDSSTGAIVKEQVQIFIALFDYDPATMSPNPDAVESELPFSEGQLIKVGLVHSGP